MINVSGKDIVSAIYDDVIRCTQCNLCILGCPLFMGTRYDHYSPRGIIVLVRDYIEGRIGIEGFLSYLVYLCNLCKNCDVRCPSKIKITDIVIKLRKMLSKEGKEE